MSATQTLVVASTNLFRLKGVRDVITRLYPTDATVVGRLYDSTGATLIAGPIAMPYVALTSGRSTEYRGVLAASVALVAGTSYLLKVSATDAAGDVRVFQRTCLAIAG